jgi:oxygen-independent coproporphyrinogen-3 oxidase
MQHLTLSFIIYLQSIKIQRILPGLYIHIPYCKQACHYCDFHFSTRNADRAEMLAAICKEIELRSSFLEDRSLTSIYFGGGTPSLLDESEWMSIWDSINEHFTIPPGIEVTMEANPDDLDRSKLSALARSPINRLSIGIQSFRDEDLQWMNRAHNRRQALQCLEDAKALGFQNISIDLIYGSPNFTPEALDSNLEIVMAFGIPHLSCYALTVERKTVLAHQVKKGLTKMPKDQAVADQFMLLMDIMDREGYEHYEISNFALPNYRAIHNSNYWQRVAYLGVGPSAHSFQDQRRSWNIANNRKYITGIQTERPYREEELLTTDEAYNEYIMTGLRTKEGCTEGDVRTFGERYLAYFQKHVVEYLNRGWVELAEDRYQLTQKGKIYADLIASDLFVV